MDLDVARFRELLFSNYADSFVELLSFNVHNAYRGLGLFGKQKKSDIIYGWPKLQISKSVGGGTQTLVSCTIDHL